MSRRVMWRAGLILGLMLGCTNGSSVPPEERLSVEFDRFFGVWFDIAHLPHPLSENCVNTRSLFTELEADSMGFVFECQEPDNLWYHTGGEVVRSMVDPDHFLFEFEDILVEASLSLSFWVLDADWEAGWMALGNPQEGWFWLWARDPDLEAGLRDRIIDDVEGRGLYGGLGGELTYTGHR